MAAGMSGSICGVVHDTQKRINSFYDFAKILKDVPVNDCRRIRNSLLKENAIQSYLYGIFFLIDSRRFRAAYKVLSCCAKWNRIR